MTFSENFINRALFTGICVMWSFTWLAGKYQVQNGLSQEFGVLYRFFGVGLVSLICSLIFKNKLKTSIEELKVIFIYTCGCASLYMILLYYAAGYMITSISAIIFSFTVIIAGIIKHILKISSEKIGIILLSFSIGIVGLFFIMIQKLHPESSKNLKIGILLAFLSTFIYSLGSLYYEKNKNKITLKPFAMFVYVALFSVLICFCVGVVKSIFIGKIISYKPNELPLSFIISYFYLVFSAFGIMLMTILIKRVGVVKASFVNITTPVFAVLISSIFEDYQILHSTIFGILLIMISNYIILRHGTKKIRLKA